ncbi:MAG: urease accessory protein UreF [Chloroflexaceae bacterium]|nr:urease accessory protein UreF [Chloroflexaceae bacterium]
MNDATFLALLQLASPGLPVGAYSYSEGLETLVESKAIANLDDLQHWLQQELGYGAIRLEAAVMVRARDCYERQDWAGLHRWNHWLGAARETAELRQQSQQMGQSLLKLLLHLQPQLQSLTKCFPNPCHHAIAFGLGTANWDIEHRASVLAYLHSWAANLIIAGVKLIPLGQTSGQQLLLQLHPYLSRCCQEILTLGDDGLQSCSWGLGLASMAHETQYTRLFRS